MSVLTYEDYGRQLQQHEATLTYRDPTELLSAEVFWKEHQPWLLSKGYILRSRYDPNWIPSWSGTDKHPSECEDYETMKFGTILDATRITDNTQVSLKSVWRAEAPQEVTILQYLSQKEMESRPDNHSVPIIEILEVPNHQNHCILVMPLLRPFDSPPIQTIGEAIDFFRQIFIGLKFLHGQNIVHRDCCAQNIMMEASKMYPKGFHPVDIKKKRDGKGRAKHFSRTERPPRYCFIDFGLSSRYMDNGSHLEEPARGGDKSVPEHQGDKYYIPCDPFPADIYYLGNLIKTEFVEPNINLGFMRELVNDMTQEDLSKRPKIDEVVKRFDKIMKGLSWFRLRSRIVPKHDLYFPPIYIVKEIIHFVRTISYIVRFLPALPPSPTPRSSYRAE